MGSRRQYTAEHNNLPRFAPTNNIAVAAAQFSGEPLMRQGSWVVVASARAGALSVKALPAALPL